MNNADLKIRVLKTWITRDYSVVMQCQNPLYKTQDDQSKRIHFIIDLKQQNFGLKFSTEKPEDASANHAFVQILRKYVPQFTIKTILESTDHTLLWIPLLSHDRESEPWSLSITCSRPPLMSLVSPDLTVFVTYGQKGTFTKKHNLSQTPALDGYTNILPELIIRSVNKKVDGLSTEQFTLKKNPTLDSHIILSKLQRDLIARLKRKQKTIKRTLEKIARELPDPTQVKDLERNASLLQSYAYLVKPEAIELRLDPTCSGTDEFLLITLNPELNLGQQIESAFQQARKIRRSLEMGTHQLSEANRGLLTVEQDLQDLKTNPKGEIELLSIIRRYKLPELGNYSEKKTHVKQKPFKTYFASSGHKILVGKGAIENDELTKSARSNDFWIHAVGTQGSHVIIPIVADIKQSVPTHLIREAAILAIHFSKLREEQCGECYVTRKSKIKKQKGMPLGLWKVEQSETFYFRYSREELQKILDTVSI